MPTCARRRCRAVPENPLRARSPAAIRAFTLYLRWYFRRNFHAVRLSRSGIPAVPDGRPVIICSNHPGWWDPALFLLLQHILMPGRVGFGPMDQAALAKYGLLRRMGVFGIESGTRRGAAQFLEHGLRVLADPHAALWVTAEGAFTDPRSRPVRLRGGIAHLARRVPEAVILPLALEYVFWNERKPEALVHFGPPIEAASVRDVAAWTALLEDGLTHAIDTLAAASMTRNPVLFVPVLRGRTGVGGVYDLWRRAASLAAGRRFEPSHGSSHGSSHEPSHEGKG